MGEPREWNLDCCARESGKRRWRWCDAGARFLPVIYPSFSWRVCVFPRFHVGYIQYKFAANFDLSLQLAEMCSLAAAMPESAALFSLLAYPPFPPFIYRNSRGNERSRPLLIRCAWQLLAANEDSLRGLAAISLLRCGLPRQVRDLCSQPPREPAAHNTAVLLDHLAAAKIAREIPAPCEVDGTFFSPRGELAKLLHGDRGEVERRAAQNEEKTREIVTAIRSDRDAVSRGTMVGMAGNYNAAGSRGSPRFSLPVRAFRRDGAEMSGFPRRY